MHPCSRECFRKEWVQVTASELENSGYPGHDAVSVGQAVRHVGL